MNIFEFMYDEFKFTKDKITLFEAFAGIGSQHIALKQLAKEFNFELDVIGISEIDKYAIASYNAIHGGTKNYGSITDIQEIPYVDIFTYSFPCQDISLAGNQKGFSKGSGTRSGLLWEVERLLENQLKINKLPKVLLMENVKALVGMKFKDDFIEWQLKLEELGYRNYWEVLNAKHYGIPQNRERVFMISVLGDYHYNFPKGFPLKLRLKDMLEPEVDDKYYLSAKMLKGMQTTKFHQYSLDKQQKDIEGIADTILARFEGAPQVILIPEATKKGYAEATDGDGIQLRQKNSNGTHVKKGMAQTITKSPDIGVVVYEIKKKVKIRKNKVDIKGLQKELLIKKTLTNKEIAKELNLSITLIEHWFRKDKSFSIPNEDSWFELKELLNITTTIFDKSIMEFVYKDNNYDKSNRVYDEKGISPTLMTGQNTGVVVYDFSSSENFLGNKSRIKKNVEIMDTILTSPKKGIVINPLKGRSNYGWHFEQQVYDENGITRTIKASQGSDNMPKVIENNLRIRKLTPLECYRLMGFNDQDFAKAEKVCSNSQLYRQAGNSIVVDVLYYIFKNLF